MSGEIRLLPIYTFSEWTGTSVALRFLICSLCKMDWSISRKADRLNYFQNLLKLSCITRANSVCASDGAYLLQPSICKKELSLFVAVQEARNANCIPTVVTRHEPGVLLPVATIRCIAQRTECFSSFTGLNCSLYKVDVWERGGNGSS